MKIKKTKPFSSGKKPITLTLNAISAAALLYCASASAVISSITLSGDYIKIGTNYLGTLGSGGNTSPGILYDNTGTGTFNTAYDYLTPGIPFEGFTVRSTSSGSTYNALSNNTGNQTSGLTGTLANISSGSYQGVTWTGSYTPSGGSKLYDIVNTVGFNASDKKVTITTTITAAQALSNVYFARYEDPDARAAAGDSSATNNFRGNGTVPGTNLVYAEALASKYVIGLYSAAASGVNTGVSSAWSTDPTVYYSGTNNGNGDYVIGLAYNTASLNVGESITYTYYYIFGSDIAAAIAASVGGLSVLGSSTAMSNHPAYGAASIIDSTPELISLFASANLTGDQQVSNAASQTLPLLTGGSMVAATNALSGINRVVQARIESNRGLSSGDEFLGDKYFWMKPFGSWADQNDRNGVSGFKADTWGLALGADKTLSNTTRLGVALAYAKSNVTGNSAVAPNSADVDIYQLIGYGSYSLNPNTDLNFQVDVGQNKNKGQRTITFVSSVASADYDSVSAHAGVGVGRTIQLNERTQFIPSVRADYTWIKDDGYTETGAGALNLNVASRSTEELILGVDGKIVHNLNDRTALNGTLGVGYDTINNQASITATFAGAPGASFVTYGIDPSPWVGHAGLGLTHTMVNGAEVTARYDAEFRQDFLNQTASVKVRWAF